MICDKNKCVGCFSCYNICPKNAITMKEDENGFIYPEIDKEKCINCNLCKKVCPALNTLQYNKIITCYAAQRKNMQKLEESSSGGAASVFAEYVLKNNGIVYGTSFEKGFKIKFTRIDNDTDLSKLKGSKYVHSYVDDAYKNVKKDLIAKKQVLFIGTPCQIAGLKLFLMKEYENLLCVDLICHGVPSQDYLKSELLMDNIELSEVKELKFRKNNEFKILLKNEKQELLNKDMHDSRYYRGFMNSFFYRENCYECKYAKSERISDITIGDFWGLNSNSSLYDEREKGVSTILICSEKGEKFISKCINQFNYDIRPVEEAIEGNTQLRKPAPQNKKYNKFKKYYKKYGFYKAYDKVNPLQSIKMRLKKYKIIRILYFKIKGCE